MRSVRYAGASAQSAPDHLLGDLHRIGGGALSQVVRHLPQPQTLAGQVLANASDQDLVVSGHACRGREYVVGGIVDDAARRGNRPGRGAPSATESGRSVSTNMVAEWPTGTGTRTHVILTASSAIDRILRVSKSSLTSSVEYPSSRKVSHSGTTLYAIGAAKIDAVGLSPLLNGIHSAR